MTNFGGSLETYLSSNEALSSACFENHSLTGCSRYRHWSEIFFGAVHQISNRECSLNPRSAFAVCGLSGFSSLDRDYS